MVSLASRVTNSLFLQEIKPVQGPADIQSQASFGTAMKYYLRITSFLQTDRNFYPLGGQYKNITTVGKDMEKSQSLCTVGGNVKWHSCYGKQYGQSSKY